MLEVISVQPTTECMFFNPHFMEWPDHCDPAIDCVGLQPVQLIQHNDFMFGGKFGFEITCPRRAMVYDLDFYRGLWSGKTVKEWSHIIDGISDNAIRRIIES